MILFSLVGWILPLLIIYAIARGLVPRRRISYRWLQKELPIWEQEQIISADQSKAIYGRYKLKPREFKRKVDMIRVLTLIGAIFVGVGVIFFVASNWQRIAAPLRTLLLLSVTIGTLCLGYFFSYSKEGFAHLGKSLFFLASLLWGGTIALIAQIYNLPVSQNWLIMLLWAFPILPIAVFFKIEYVHILASVLFLIWNFLYTVNNYVPNYYYPLIVFLVILPTAVTLPISRRINIAGLLIVSLYCCFNKYEWLAFWIGAGLLVYYLVHREEFAYLYATGIALICWTITFTTVRDMPPNVYFLIPLGVLFYLSYQGKEEKNLIICLAGLLIWLNLSVYSLSQIFGLRLNGNNIIVLQALAGITMYSLGMVLKAGANVYYLTYKIFGYVIAFVALYLMSFQDLVKLSGRQSLNNAYFTAGLVLTGAMALLLGEATKKGYFNAKAARMELPALAAAVAVGFVLLMSRSVAVSTVAANAVLVIFAVTNIFLGVELKMPPVFSAGTGIFALFIITRYVDTGWKLKDKSLFFIVGGLVILGLGVFLEKQRRLVIERMK